MAFALDENSLYHQTKALISFWCRRGLNPKSLIQLSEILPVELTGTHYVTLLLLVYNPCICMVQLKKNYNCTHIWIQITLSLSLSFFFFLISFGYTWVYSFFFIFFYWVFDDLFILDLVFCILLTHLEQKIKKKKN